MSDPADEPRIIAGLRALGFQDGYIPTLLTYEDDEILDEILRSHPRLRLRDRRDIESALGEFRGQAPPSDPDWDGIIAAHGRWTTREGNHDQVMPKDEMLAESGMGRDRLDATLRRHGVTDFRRLRSVIQLQQR